MLPFTEIMKVDFSPTQTAGTGCMAQFKDGFI